MIVAEYLPPRSHVLWELARQMGVRCAIVNAKPERTGLNPPWDIDALRRVQREFGRAGLKIHGLEGDQFDMGRIKLGLDGRDEDIERCCRMLRNMGELGIPLLCYNFMAQIGWFRSSVGVAGRGGALVSQFDLKEMPTSLTEAGEIPAERIWESYRYFVQHVMPVAEKAGVRMALHPDDPPLASLRGIGRIFGTPEAFERAYSLAPSPCSWRPNGSPGLRMPPGSISSGATIPSKFTDDTSVFEKREKCHANSMVFGRHGFDVDVRLCRGGGQAGRFRRQRCVCHSIFASRSVLGRVA